MKDAKSIFTAILLILTGCQKELLPAPEDVKVLEIISEEVDDTFLIRIHLPTDYAAATATYPVLYQLDGNTTTGSVINNYEKLIEQDLIQECIIVTIYYTFQDQRNRDFTPSFRSDFDAESGGADSFLSFLAKELVPLIDSNYRVSQDIGNTLRGHSLGGLFASYAMFKSAEMAPLGLGLTLIRAL
ncbi:MAG: alpha/beta hydrolase-fold protein [Bacteroidota bacterium]